MIVVRWRSHNLQSFYYKTAAREKGNNIINTLRIRKLNAINLGKRILATIFRVIVLQLENKKQARDVVKFNEVDDKEIRHER